MPPKRKIAKPKQVIDEKKDDIYTKFATIKSNAAPVKSDSMKSDPSFIDAQHINNKFEPQRELFFVRPEDRMTSEYITKYEYTRVLSIRAKQIEKDNVVQTDVTNITDPIEMAKKEVRDKRCPMSIERKINENLAELWHVNEMVVRFN